MNPKDRKTIFFNRLKKLLDDDITKYDISPEHNLFIKHDKYIWRFAIDFIYIEVDLQYREKGFSTKYFYDTTITIFNIPFFIKLIKFYYKCKKIGLNKIYKKQYEELPDDLKNEKLLIDRSKKIKKLLK